MFTKQTLKTALIITLLTGVVGLALFFGSVHSGGTPFYLGMVFLPPLYLLYADLIPINNLFVIAAIALVIQYYFWVIIIFAFKKALGSSHENNNAI